MTGLAQRVAHGMAAAPRRVGARPLLLSVAGGITAGVLSQTKVTGCMHAQDESPPPVSSDGKKAASDKHWSGVEAGQKFTFTIEFDESYSKRVVVVHAGARHAVRRRKRRGCR